MVRSFDVRYPFDDSITGQAPDYNAEELMNETEKCASNQKKLDADSIIIFFEKLHQTLKFSKDVFAESITRESGLCIKDSLHEVERTLAVIEHCKNLVETLENRNNHIIEPPIQKAKLNISTEPLDLSLAITPFNHPLNQVAHKILPGIVAKANIVLKPSEKTPLTAIRFIKTLNDCGLPPNQVRVITTKSPELALKTILNHPRLEMITFTGGVATGKHILKTVAESPNPFIKTVFELGGNAVLYISEKADIDLAADIAMGAFKNSGQRCTAINSIFIHRSIKKEFETKFTQAALSLKSGDPLDIQTDVGTVIDQQSANRIQTIVSEAIQNGAKLICGNLRKKVLFSPTILTDIKPESQIINTEIFGPVAPIVSVDHIEQALDFVQNSRFALAGAIVTKDKSEAERFFAGSPVGQFNWNGPPGFRFENAPFGGFRLSGNYTKEGVKCCADNYLKQRTLYSHRR